MGGREKRADMLRDAATPAKATPTGNTGTATTAVPAGGRKANAVGNLRHLTSHQGLS